jgi:hypothetical protein
MKTHSLVRLFSIAALGCLFIGVSAQAVPIQLFNGKNFDGWEGDTKQVWRIEQNEVVAGNPNSKQPKNDFLCTTREYGDFELRLKYKRGKNNGGIQFRSKRVPNNHEVSGYQADFAPGIDGCLYDESRRRAFLAKPSEEVEKQLQLAEWNSYRLRAIGPRIQLWINDVMTVDYTETDPKIPLTGIIALQLHVNAMEIRYKDITIEELGANNGLVRLFNGQNLAGWHYQGDPDLSLATEAKDGRYSAKEGSLVVNPENPARGPHLRQLWTIEEFSKDFVLKLKFRASVNADSGIFIRGIQLQCRDYLVAGPYKNLKAYKAQDWNEIVVTVKGNIAHCTCNGELLTKTLTVPDKGPVGLEADRGQMEYRDIEITPL